MRSHSGWSARSLTALVSMLMVGAVAFTGCNGGGGDDPPSTTTPDTPTAEPTADTPTAVPTADTPTAEPTADTPTAEPEPDEPFGVVINAILEAFVNDLPASVSDEIEPGDSVSTRATGITGSTSVLVFSTLDVSQCTSTNETELLVRPNDQIALKWLGGGNGTTTCQVVSGTGPQQFEIECVSGDPACTTMLETTSTVFSVQFIGGAAVVDALESEVRMVVAGQERVLAPGFTATVITTASRFPDLAPQPSADVPIVSLSPFVVEFLLSRGIEPPVDQQAPQQNVLDVVEDIEFFDELTRIALRIRPGLIDAEGRPIDSELVGAVIAEDSLLRRIFDEIEIVDDETVVLRMFVPSAEASITSGLRSVPLEFSETDR